MMLRCVADKGRNIQTLFILQKESATGHVINILKPLCRPHEIAMKPEHGGDGHAYWRSSTGWEQKAAPGVEQAVLGAAQAWAKG